MLIFPSCALTFTAGLSIWRAPICHGHPGAVLESGEPWLLHGASTSCPWCRGCTCLPSAICQLSLGVASLFSELHLSNTSKYPHSRTCASVQPRACSPACTCIGVPTNLPGRTSTSVSAHAALHSWFRAHALAHSAHTSGFAHAHPLWEVLVTCRVVSLLCSHPGPRVQPRKMDLGSLCPARGDGFGVTMPS